MMFGEHVDENNLESIVFPRAAAVVSLNTNDTIPPLFNNNINIFITNLVCTNPFILLRVKGFGVHPLSQVWKINKQYKYTYYINIIVFHQSFAN